MKSSINRLFVIALLCIAAATSAARAATPTWAENYGVGTYDANGKANSDPFYGSGFDYPRAIAPMPDGGFVVAGQIAFPFLTLHSTSNGASDAVLVRFGADGTILWQQELRQTNDLPGNGTYTPAPSYISRIRTDAQGNIFVAGGKGNPSNSGQVPFVAKFSPAGQLIWQNGIPSVGGTVPGTPPQPYTAGVSGSSLEIGLTFDGGIVLTSVQGRPAGYTVPIITKFDPNGAVSLYRAYENPDQYAPSGPVAQTADGSKYVTIIGHQLPADPNVPNAPYGLFVFVIDTAGNVLAQRAFAAPDGGREYPLALIRTSDGGFASISAEDDYSRLVFRQFNADASAVTFERLITPATGQQVFYAGSLSHPADTGSFSQTSDGGFLIGGHTSKAGSGFAEDAALMKLHADGTVEFVSIIGGIHNEGGSNYGASGSVATPLVDGGYGIAISSTTYVTAPAGEDFRQKSDWWLLKTDANRKVRNFTGIMTDLNSFNVSTSSPHSPVAISYLSTPPYSAGPLPGTAPEFTLVDLAERTGVDRPSMAIQASGPRIVSSRTAEAVVGQHFAYHILTAFFSTSANVTYSAAGLPQGFVIDPATGVISGVAAAGTETANPIVITLSASDGVDTPQLTLLLSIGDGVPVFTVNGSDQPATGLADTVLTLATTYPGQRAGRVVTAQSATNPQGPWTDLDTGLSGYMTPDFNSGAYVLGTTNYPQQSGVYFRSRVVTKGFATTEAISNVVGPFDLGSNKARAGKTVFRLKRNGLRVDFDFRVTELAAAPGIALRVQTTRTPSVESSWTDLTDSGGNNISAMAPDGNSSHYALLKPSLPAGTEVYFRAIAAGSGLVDATSNFIGSYTFGPATPPTVSISSPGSGTPDNPFIINANANGIASINVHATATAGANRSIAYFAVLLDGEPMFSIPGGTATATIDYLKNTTAIGDHVLEAVAVDDQNVIARAGTQPTYIRILSAPSSAAAFSAETATTQATTFRSEIFTVANSGGNWDNPSTWSDSRGNPGVPTSTDFVVIGSSTVNLNGSGGTVFALSINGGHVTGPGQLQVGNLLTIYGGSFDASVTLVVKSGAVCEMVNPADFHFDGVFQNQGTLNVHGARSLTGLQLLLNTGLINYQLPLLPSAQVALGLPPDLRAIAAQLIQDTGKVSVQSLVTDNGSGIVTIPTANLIGEKGAALISPNGGTLITNDGGSLITNDGGSLITNDGGSLITNDGGSIISNDGASIISNDGASLAGRNGGVFKAGGNGAAATTAEAATATSGYQKRGGEINLDGITIIGPVSLEAGVINGSGILLGDVTNNGGYVSPGHSAGGMLITGSFTQNSGGTLIMEAGGAEAGTFDQIEINGAANLGGKLDLKTIGGYVPFPNDPLNQLTASTTSGSFASVSSNGSVTVTSTGMTTTTNPAAPNPSSGQPLNIATRMSVQTGDNVLIAGFIITGPNGSTKKVLIRGLGPSLAQFGVSNTLSDPLLELHKSDGTVTNDNWQQGDTSQIPNGFAPSDPREAVIVATLTPGNYSAVVKGAHGETGVGIAEVYDLDATSPAKLGNIATRGFINTGDDVMIGGFIVGGNEPAKILVRAIGPSLADFGVQGALADPTLELHDSNGMSISNDNWRETQEAEIIATTIPPNKDQEPAILATLVPGNYTAVVRGKNNTTGIGLVEAYNLQ